MVEKEQKKIDLEKTFEVLEQIIEEDLQKASPSRRSELADALAATLKLGGAVADMATLGIAGNLIDSGRKIVKLLRDPEPPANQTIVNMLTLDCLRELERRGKVNDEAMAQISGRLADLQKTAAETKEIAVEIKKDTTRTVELLEDQLRVKDSQISFLQNQIKSGATPEPSPEAVKLAEQIPDDADPYARALKAIAEKRLDEARELLDLVIGKQEVDLTKAYTARGKTEYYAGRYADAATWYEKALTLKPNDPAIINDAGLAYHLGGKYKQAEPLYEQALEIRKEALGEDHPDYATDLNNLAELYRAQGKYEQAEPLYEQALAICEKALGKEHPNTIMCRRNYEKLLEEMRGKR